jgi:hypothetical protein
MGNKINVTGIAMTSAIIDIKTMNAMYAEGN